MSIVWREGQVVRAGRKWAGAQEFQVTLTDGSQVKALAYLEVVGCPAPGDTVLLNVTTLQLGLGTGGYAMIVALPGALPADPPAGPGHMVKARYTPLQQVVLGVDEQDSEHHGTLEHADDLSGMPVVATDLHSALGAVIAGVRASDPQARIAYVMTDTAALPAAFSRTIATLRDSGWLATCITAGQAYGGDYEAVSVPSALLAARLVAGADLAIVIQGPGNLGTGTRFGYSGVAVADVLNATSALHGRSVAALRISGADERGRHFGVSHHSLTVLNRLTLAPVQVVVPDLAGTVGDLDLTALDETVREQVTYLEPPAGRHTLVPVKALDLMDALAACPAPLSTMGRTLAQDPAGFLAAAAAGRHAATLLDH